MTTERPLPNIETINPVPPERYRDWGRSAEGQAALASILAEGAKGQARPVAWRRFLGRFFPDRLQSRRWTDGRHIGAAKPLRGNEHKSWRAAVTWVAVAYAVLTIGGLVWLARDLPSPPVVHPTVPTEPTPGGATTTSLGAGTTTTTAAMTSKTWIGPLVPTEPDLLAFWQALVDQKVAPLGLTRMQDNTVEVLLGTTPGEQIDIAGTKLGGAAFDLLRTILIRREAAFRAMTGELTVGSLLVALEDGSGKLVSSTIEPVEPRSRPAQKSIDAGGGTDETRRIMILAHTLWFLCGDKGVTEKDSSAFENLPGGYVMACQIVVPPNRAAKDQLLALEEQFTVELQAAAVAQLGVLPDLLIFTMEDEQGEALYAAVWDVEAGNWNAWQPAPGWEPSDDRTLAREDASGRTPADVVLALVAAKQQHDWQSAYSLFADPGADYATAAADWTEAAKNYQDFTVQETRVEDENDAFVRVTYRVETTPPSPGTPYTVVVKEPGQWWNVEKVSGLWKAAWLTGQ